MTLREIAEDALGLIIFVTFLASVLVGGEVLAAIFHAE